MTSEAHHLLDIYSVWLHAVSTRKGWRKLCKQIDSLDPKGCDSLGMTSSDVDGKLNQLHISIFVATKKHRADKTGAAFVETCAHEATHAAGFIFDHFGQGYDGRSEAFGYLSGWIAQWVWGSLRGDQ